MSADDRIPRRRKRKKKSAKAPLVLWFALGGGLLLVVLVAGAIGILWALGVFGPKPTTGATGFQSSTETPRDRLIGQWDFNSAQIPEAKMILDVSKSGTFRLTGINKGKSVVEDATWQVLSEKKDRLTIRIQFKSQSQPVEWDIELLPNNEMRINFLSGNSAPIIYKRTK